MSTFVNQCPCGSNKEYDHCCKVFHDGQLPENALLLMRSRFSAYALNLPDYIIDTTHPASPQYTENRFAWKKSISQFSRDSSFNKLTILDFKENKTLSTVTFTAYISQDGKDTTFTERSYFEKIGNKWFYRGGKLAEGYAPHLVLKEELGVLPLAYLGDQVLRKVADSITEITPELKKLIERMIGTMDASSGIGLAAPQVHHSIQLFVMRKPIANDQGGYDSGEVQVFINPKLSLPSEETWEATEGCLSIPIIRSLVERPKEITVEYTTLDNTFIKQRFAGWEARVIMHEHDHINGIFFIDRLSQEEQSKLQPFLQRFEKRIQDSRNL